MAAIFQFTGDFNVGTEDLCAGHYVLLATTYDEPPLPLPLSKLEVKDFDLLVDEQHVTH